MEILYCCGLRRFEVTGLTLYSLDVVRKTLMVRQGKYKKDRLVPISQRAVDWIERYLEESRPKLAIDPNEKTLFLSITGVPLIPNTLSELVRDYIKKADIGKTGSCHLFRHTMATLMLENGADIRFVQAMLGHANIQTTEVYTQVSIKKLQQVHALTHPSTQPPPPEADTTNPPTDNAASSSAGNATASNAEPETPSLNASTDRPSDSQPESPKDSTNKRTDS